MHAHANKAPTNLAYNQQTTQSSSYLNDSHVASSNAVDNTTNGNWAWDMSNSITH
ncbi:hypothetical protein MNB_SUP05-SYMBIONT-5-1409 [hydrothermal vent metagenome]|uniref:Uncharacterized protein n=1 Tax=hydrothermal vent metagenome TaxID=652676 RepID=A0A1W1E4Y5_9ZZZZ